MVIDIDKLRQAPETVRKSEEGRYRDPALFEEVQRLDEEWRKVRYTGDCLARSKNVCKKVAGKKIQAGDVGGASGELPEDLQHVTEDLLKNLSVDQIKCLSKTLDTLIASNVEILSVLEVKRNRHVNEIGNILHPDVIINNNEDFNGIIRMHGDTTTTKPRSHIDLVEMLNGADFTMGTKNSGSRCYYLQGHCLDLEVALTTFAYNFMKKRNYERISPPIFMNKEAMQEVSQLTQFDSELYKVVCKRNEDPSLNDGEEEKYLIATSEQPMVAKYRDSWIPKSSLPIRIMGISECFRQEVGSHGRDTRGIFRVHQFKKVEQFCITSPHDGESDKMFEEMISNSESFYQALGIPYRVVSIVSGELNNAAAIKYDLEGWFPGSGAFRELVSCSNCTDYQSRSVHARFGETKKMNKSMEFVHMLNCTLCATTRVICAILENYQTDEGIVVPEVLRNNMGCDFIPFLKVKK